MIDPLRELEGARYPELALSLYLPAGPARERRFYDAQLKDIEKEQAASRDDRELAALRREFDAVRAWFATVNPPGKPLCLLSCQPAGMFESYWLPDPVETEVWIDERLNLLQLRKQGQRHSLALIVVIDSEKARVFTTFLGNVQDVADLKGEDIKTHKQGGWSAEKHQRHEEQYVHWQMKTVAQWLARADPNGKIPVYLAGPVEDRTVFKKELPKALQQAVTREFPAPLYLKTSELAERLKAAV
jgi:hypothetical protein